VFHIHVGLLHIKESDIFGDSSGSLHLDLLQLGPQDTTPFLFLSISQLSIHFSPPVTYSVTATYGGTLTPVACRGFPVPELGEFGFRGGIGLELESLCHSSLFSAVADSNLQLQKIWFLGSFGEFILGIQSYYQ